MTDKTTTVDVSSLTNRIVMAIDKEFRKNDIPFAHRHAEFRPLIEGLVTTVVVDQVTKDVAAEVASGLTKLIQDEVTKRVTANVA